MAKVIFTAGSPGAGKGFILKRDYSETYVVDCDRIKQSHPDYDPKNPGAVHAWSSEQATREYFEMLAYDEDFIFDGTGTDTDKLVNFINQAHLAGFETEILYVKVSLAVALERNAKRARTVPVNLLKEKFALIATAVDILSGYAMKVTTVNNS